VNSSQRAGLSEHRLLITDHFTNHISRHFLFQTHKLGKCHLARRTVDCNRRRTGSTLRIAVNRGTQPEGIFPYMHKKLSSLAISARDESFSSRGSTLLPGLIIILLIPALKSRITCASPVEPSLGSVRQLQGGCFSRRL